MEQIPTIEILRDSVVPHIHWVKISNGRLIIVALFVASFPVGYVIYEVL